MARLKFILRPLVMGLLAIWLVVPAQAGTRTFTGAELFTDPNVSFPTTIPVVSGSSLIFGSGTVANEKLLVLPLLPAGSLSGTTPETISISINLTRLACVGPCVGGAADHDPHLLLCDSANLVGAVIADNNGGEFLGTTLIDSGTFGSSRTLSSIFTSAGFPAIDVSFDINVDFTLQTGLTSVDVSFGTGSGIFNENARALAPSSALGFVFMRNNDVGEQYQINSLTVTTPGLEFADFTLKQAQVKFGTYTGGLDDVHLQGHVTLDEGGNGIDLMNDDVVVRVGTSSFTIPAGSFIARGSKFHFAGDVGGADIKMSIAEKSGEVEFSVMAKGVDLTDTSNPVKVGLQIGDDEGETSVRLQGVLNLGGGM